MKCPKCNGIRFSVTIQGYQIYDGELDEYGEVEVTNIEGDKPFFCLNCEGEFEEKDLIK